MPRIHHHQVPLSSSILTTLALTAQQHFSGWICSVLRHTATHSSPLTLAGLFGRWGLFSRSLLYLALRYVRGYGMSKVISSKPPSQSSVLIATGSEYLLHVETFDKFKGKDFELDREEGKMPTVAEIFKETRQLKSGALDEESTSKRRSSKYQKITLHFSAFELVKECFGPQDRDHVACFGYGMKPKDVRGPLPSIAALQAMLREKEKENIALHKRMDDMENAHKNNTDKLEDWVRILANLVMANQQTSSANTGSDQDDVYSMSSFLTALASMGWHCALN
ncbi:hypothetical protein Cgig2_027109 [Carnegiea gigantea]|uniref:Uncharacterized protein n=1 Tax=Carnegiea gigantea TaxID=171969 RepID=A0A9Q1Q768_9CARY|nr:hypothetical protein Cgig2_027109 [Carnegiea gigantea]